MRYTELTCIPYWTSKTDIVGQVLGPGVCVFMCVGIDPVPASLCACGIQN